MKLIGQVSQQNIEDLRNWCKQQIENMTKDVSSYAPGRQRLWLFSECDLRNGKVKPSYYDVRIWKFSQLVYPGCNIGLLTYNGTINWHRDHNYALPVARGVNLGECQFGIRDKGIESINHLTDGKIYEFNCKNPHAVLSHSDERFSLTFWKMRESYVNQLDLDYPF